MGKLTGMSLLALGLLALALEAGWLAVWPLSGALSHSALFTAAVLADHPLSAATYATTLDLAQRILPGLGAAPFSEPLGHAVYAPPTAALTVVFVWLAVAYLAGLAVLNRGIARRRLGLAVVLLATLLFHATLLWLPGLFSQDVFSYVAYGRLAATYDLNPYVWPPSAVAKDTVLPWVAPLWRSYTAPYGPVWLDVQWLMTRLMGGMSIADQALAYRCLAQGALVLNLGLLWAILRRQRALDSTQRTVALAALAWNPLVLFELGANAHNDALMVSFSLLAILLFDRSRFGVFPTIGLTLGALIKYLSGIGILWVALASAARAPSLLGQVVRTWLVGTLCAVVVVLMALPWLELPDSLDPLLAETGNVGYVNSLPDSVAVAVADTVFGRPASGQRATAREVTRGVERLLCLAAFGGYLIWEARRVLASPTAPVVAAATARSCLIYILLVSTSVQSWYFCLPVALALTLGWGHVLSQVTIGYSLLALPALYDSYYLRDGAPLPIFLAYGLLPLAPLLLRVRSRQHDPTPVSVAWS